MDENQKTFLELQEIIFWQQINKQLIKLKAGGKDIRDEHQKYIQTFFFNNLLFSKITGAALLDEVPMGLVTDLSNICFVNLKLSSWNRCLTELIPDSYVLDIEQAFADSFDAMGKYDKKYYLGNDKNGGDEDDEELYEFIKRYLGEREKHGRDIVDLIQKTYELKNDVIQWIMRFSDYRPFLATSENRAFFDFRNADKQSEILENYLENFCRKALSVIEPTIFLLKEFDLYGLLYEKEDEKNLKPSIKEFVDHELDITQRETDLLRSFSNKILTRINSPDIYKIDICDLSPFSFLDSPFPTV